MSPAIMMLSRNLKRVPLDFDWPMNKVWKGYVWPTPRPCPAGDRCDLGRTMAGAWLERMVFLFGVIMHSVESGELHPWLRELPLAPEGLPGPDFAELMHGLGGASGPLGWGSSGEYAMRNKIIETAGLDPETWGVCPSCHGHDHHPDDQAMLDAFEATEPPEGDGYQLWESVSEGSPCSPVFKTKPELAAWLSANDDSILSGKSVADWMRVLDGEVHGSDIATGELV